MRSRSFKKSLAEEAPVIEFVNGLFFAKRLDRMPQDVHGRTKVRPGFEDRGFRVDGVLTDRRTQFSVYVLSSVVTRIKILSGMDIAERPPATGWASDYSRSAKKVDLRCVILPATERRSGRHPPVTKEIELPDMQGLGLRRRRIPGCFSPDHRTPETGCFSGHGSNRIR